MSNSRKKGFWEVLKDHVCAIQPAIRAIFGICGAAFVFLLVSLTVVEPSSATYVLVVVDLVSVAVIAATMGTLLHVCGIET